MRVCENDVFLSFPGGFLLHGPEDADHGVHDGAAGAHRRIPLARSPGNVKKRSLCLLDLDWPPKERLAC